MHMMLKKCVSIIIFKFIILCCNTLGNDLNELFVEATDHKLMYTQQRSRPSSTKSGFLDWGLLSSGLGGAVAVLSSSGSLAPAVDGKDPGNPPGKPPTPHGNELLNTSIILASLGFDLYFSILVGFFIISCRAAITSGSLILDNRSIKFAPAEKPPGILKC
ncbi:hypothetical protein GQX74_008268 [Glossina fuscipes]|nr:hypothetical protein GQX74_008268 [Glossina fuscipes]